MPRKHGKHKDTNSGRTTLVVKQNENVCNTGCPINLRLRTDVFSAEYWQHQIAYWYKPGGISFDGICYSWSEKESRSWLSAQKKCRSYGSNLISINSYEEFDLIRKALLMGNKWEFDANFLYIGIHKTSEKEQYHLIDKTPVSFTNWIENKELAIANDAVSELIFTKQFAAITKHCAAMMLYGEFKKSWFQVSCHAKYNNTQYICERPCQNPHIKSIKKVEPFVAEKYDHDFCPEYWFNFEDRCYNVIQSSSSMKIPCEAVAASHVSQHFIRNFARSTEKCRTSKALIRKVPKTNKIVFKDKITFIRNCLFQITLSQWSERLNHVDNIYIDHTALLHKSEEFLQDEWTFWALKSNYSETLSTKKQKHFLCEKRKINKKDIVPYGTFICTSTGEIISSYHLCDGISTCYHGDDELYCDGNQNKLTVEMISFLFFKCSNVSFLSYSKVKNNITDCQHGDDENSTVHVHFVSKLAPSVPDTEHCIHDRNLHLRVMFCMFYQCPFHFKCKNTYCIPHKYVCDKTLDCPYGEDEHESLCLNHTCHGQFKCVYGNHCLHYEKICDGFKDCHDATYTGEDESVCDVGRCYNSTSLHLFYCDKFACPSHFKCPRTYCIPIRHVCDGEADCPDGDDEGNCTNYSCPHATSIVQ